MNNINYDALLKEKIKENILNNIKPKVLLHSCCAPCSSTCIDRLKKGFYLSVFYYNPNIDTEDEFNKRKSEQKRLCSEFDVDFIGSEYNKQDFLDIIKGYENYPEGSLRCFICFKLRLLKTAELAKELGYDYFATTLTLSPLKNSNKINEIGKEVEKEVGISYLPTDFKKDDGYLTSIKFSKEYNLYRQNYCGCEFSKNKTTND